MATFEVKLGRTEAVTVDARMFTTDESWIVFYRGGFLEPTDRVAAFPRSEVVAVVSKGD